MVDDSISNEAAIIGWLLHQLDPDFVRAHTKTSLLVSAPGVDGWLRLKVDRHVDGESSEGDCDHLVRIPAQTSAFVLERAESGAIALSYVAEDAPADGWTARVGEHEKTGATQPAGPASGEVSQVISNN